MVAGRPGQPRDRMFLDGACTEAQAGLFVALVATNRLTEPPSTPRVVAVELIAHQWLGAAGGLLLSDSATGVTIEPGCCCGVEEWSAWTMASHPPRAGATRSQPRPRS